MALKTKKYTKQQNNQDFWKWSGLTFLTYIGALWINAMFRWFDMSMIEGIQFLFTGIVTYGFLNGAIFMTLALIFSILSAHSMSKLNQPKSKKWLGLSLIMIGIHYILYFVYSHFAGIMNFILLVDIWTFPLTFLGISLLFGKIKQKTENG
jgi:hypothetical protein